MSSIASFSISNAADYLLDLYEHTPDNLSESLTCVISSNFIWKYVFTFDPTTALVSTAFTALAMTIEAIALAIIRTNWQIEDLGDLGSFFVKGLIPLGMVGLFTYSADILTVEESVAAVFFSVTSHFCFNYLMPFFGRESNKTNEMTGCYFFYN